MALYLGNPNAHTLAGSVMGVPLIKALGTKNLYSASTVDQMPRHVACGYLFGNPAAMPVPDLDRTDYLLMLGADPLDLERRLTGTKRFAYVARGVTPQVWDQVKALGLAGILSERTSKRVYPAGDLASNVVGFVGRDGKGLGGLEYGMQGILGGTDGSVTYEVAGGGRLIPTGQEEGTTAVAGSDVTLTIDRDIQFQAQKAIATRVHADHTEFRVTPSAMGLIEKLVWHHDGAFGDSSAIPTFIVSQLTRQHVTVALSGEKLHGPNGICFSPDYKRIYVISGGIHVGDVV